MDLTPVSKHTLTGIVFTEGLALGRNDSPVLPVDDHHAVNNWYARARTHTTTRAQEAHRALRSEEWTFACVKDRVPYQMPEAFKQVAKSYWYLSFLLCKEAKELKELVHDAIGARYDAIARAATPWHEDLFEAEAAYLDSILGKIMGTEYCIMHCTRRIIERTGRLHRSSV